jgi:hypothetical protein
MAKSIIVTYDVRELLFAITRVERSKLYSTRKRIPLDDQGYRRDFVRQIATTDRY